jgi:F0F1-type ATP synthase assembly protein I
VTRDRFPERAYRALVHLYPREFREEFGDDMVALFRDQYRDESPWSVIVRSLLDLALTVPSQHVENRMHTNPTPVTTLAYLTVALAGLVLAVVGGTTPLALVTGALVAVGAGALAVVTWRRAAPFRGPTLTSQWWKFVVAGPVLIGAVIVASGLGVDAWFLGLAVVFTAIGSVVVGFGLAVANLVARHRPTPT